MGPRAASPRLWWYLLAFVYLPLSVQATAADRNRTAEKLELKFFGRALSYDWHFRSHRIPPMRETIRIQTMTPEVHGNEVTVIMEFFAFRKIWTLKLAENTVLLSNASSFEQRTASGTLLLKERGPRGCFLIGSAEADETEYGYAAVTTCNGKVRGLVITNINDYVIFSSDWRSPLTAGRKAPPQPVSPRHRRRARHALGFKQGFMEVANLTDYAKHAESVLGKVKAAKRDSQRRRRSTTRTEIGREPKLGPMPQPSGRVVHVELGTIMDKWYIDDFREQVSAHPPDLIIHAAELINNAQLWYIHPTLGFQVWLTLRNAIMINEDVGLTLDNVTHSYPAAVCKWVTETFSDEMEWDEVIMFSSKEGIWHGRSGLAQRSGVCATDGKDRCAGVSHVNFQMASLARLVAHEAMHPLGVSDDYDGLTSEICFSGIMRRGVWQDHDWSLCSVHDFERWLEMSSSSCTARHQTPSLSNSAKVPLLAVNVAWRAKAAQSSTYLSDEKWGAWKATDGGLAGVPPNGKEELGSCTHTQVEDRPWLRIELDPEYRKNVIHKIIIYNRDDCCSERLNNLEVRVGNFSELSYNPVCATYSKAVPGGRYGALSLECSKPTAGRFVSVHLQGKRQILTVCEIQVLQMVRLKEFDNRQYPCQDHHGFCPFWSAVGECGSQSQKPFMEITCPYSCGVCKRTVRAHPTSTVVAASAERTTTLSSECRDKYDSCMHSAANGDCYESYEMEERCPKSCGFCGHDNDSELEAKTTAATVIWMGSDTAVAAAESGPLNRAIIASSTSSPSQAHMVENKGGRGRTTAAQSNPSLSLGGNCLDLSPSCSAWSRAGYCATSSNTRKVCPATCQLCRVQIDSTAQPSAEIRATTGSHLRIMGEAQPVDRSGTQCLQCSTILTTRQQLQDGRSIEAPVTSASPTVRASQGTNVAATSFAHTTVRYPILTTSAWRTTHRQPTISESRSSCSDRSHACSAWKREGYCSRSVSVKRACPESCGIC